MKFLLFVLLVSLACVYANDRCPTVYDGLTNGQFDLSTQFSTSAISANWYGLEKNQILAYDWAVVSEKQLTAAFDEECRTYSGFAGNPDTMQWRNIKKDTSAVATTLNLDTSKRYYVVVRTTLTNGRQIYSNSNGILVLPTDLQKEFFEFSTKKVSEITDTEEEPENRFTTGLERNHHETSTCCLDEANRCRQADVPVSQILETLYGPATFNDDRDVNDLFLFAGTPAAAAAIGASQVGEPIDDDTDDDSDDDDDDDDDDDAGIVSGVLAAILVAIILCCLLLICIIFLIGFLISRGDDDDKFSERVVDRKTDFVDEAYGTHTERVLETDDTRVEFPDIDPHSSLNVAD